MNTPPVLKRARPASPAQRPRWKTAGGYILLEATVAMVVLGAGAYAVHGAIRQALITRAQAQDYTHARFLLERLIAEREIQPELKPGTDSGRFTGEWNRFDWQYQVRMVYVPLPSKPPINPTPRKPGERPIAFEYSIKHIMHIRATVSWVRSGRSFSESIETLFNPSKFWERRIEKDSY